MLRPIIVDEGSPETPVATVSPWNLADVEAVIEAAGRQLREEPNRDKRWVADLKAHWPMTSLDEDEVDIAQWAADMARWKAKITEVELAEAKWITDPLERHRLSEDRESEPRVPATLADATALETLTGEWLWWPKPGMRVLIDGFHVKIPTDIHGIIVGHALGFHWREMAKIRKQHGHKGSHTWVRHMYRAAKRIIVDRLNRE